MKFRFISYSIFLLAIYESPNFNSLLPCLVIPTTILSCTAFPINLYDILGWLGREVEENGERGGPPRGAAFYSKPYDARRMEIT